MAWNNQLAIAMPKRPLVGDFAPGFMMKLAHKDCRLALQMVDALGVVAPVGPRDAGEPGGRHPPRPEGHGRRARC